MSKEKRFSNKNKQNKVKNKPSDRVSDHFSKRDFTCKECGDSESCKRSFRISLGLVGGLELLRSTLNKRINIIKGFSCPDAAEKASKIRRNYHAIGVAATIQVEGATIQEVFAAAETIPEFKGIGLNVTDNTVYVDTRKTDERSMWVEEDSRFIDLTDENRNKYFQEIS